MALDFDHDYEAYKLLSGGCVDDFIKPASSKPRSHTLDEYDYAGIPKYNAPGYRLDSFIGNSDIHHTRIAGMKSYLYYSGTKNGGVVHPPHAEGIVRDTLKNQGVFSVEDLRYQIRRDINTRTITITNSSWEGSSVGIKIIDIDNLESFLEEWVDGDGVSPLQSLPGVKGRNSHAVPPASAYSHRTNALPQKVRDNFVILAPQETRAFDVSPPGSVTQYIVIYDITSGKMVDGWTEIRTDVNDFILREDSRRAVGMDGEIADTWWVSFNRIMR